MFNRHKKVDTGRLPDLREAYGAEQDIRKQMEIEWRESLTCYEGPVRFYRPYSTIEYRQIGSTGLYAQIVTAQEEITIPFPT